MRLRPPLRMSVTRRGEKEQRLGEFIGEYLAETNHARPRPGSEILLVARSVESPVVRAIAALAADIVAAGYTVRLIVAQTDADTMPRGWTLSDTVEVDCEVRWARKPRLIEAHEQLVLGPETCWIGDSMRREPTKCDAYETYMDDCARTAASATTSFERLWQTSEPLLARVPITSHGGDEAVGLARRH
jgi:hypothetical protein